MDCSPFPKPILAVRRTELCFSYRQEIAEIRVLSAAGSPTHRSRPERFFLAPD
jgi:hypothetical protein